MTLLAAVPEAAASLTRDQLEGLVEHWAARLRLDHWTITVDWDAQTDNAAEIKPWHVYDYAKIRVNQSPEKGFQTWSRLIANRNVVHELLHLCMRDVDYTVETGELVMTGNVWKLFEAGYENACEAAIDSQRSSSSSAVSRDCDARAGRDRGQGRRPPLPRREPVPRRP